MIHMHLIDCNSVCFFYLMEVQRFTSYQGAKALLSPNPRTLIGLLISNNNEQDIANLSMGVKEPNEALIAQYVSLREEAAHFCSGRMSRKLTWHGCHLSDGSRLGCKTSSKPMSSPPTASSQTEPTATQARTRSQAGLVPR